MHAAHAPFSASARSICHGVCPPLKATMKRQCGHRARAPRGQWRRPLARPNRRRREGIVDSLKPHTRTGHRAVPGGPKEVARRTFAPPVRLHTAKVGRLSCKIDGPSATHSVARAGAALTPRRLARRWPHVVASCGLQRRTHPVADAPCAGRRTGAMGRRACRPGGRARGAGRRPRPKLTHLRESLLARCPLRPEAGSCHAGRIG